MNRSSILVVDDEPDNFDVIEALLSEQDYQLHYAASGQEALATLDLVQPDIILLDVMMPGLDGIEVCRQIKAMSKWEAVPIIMVTALNTKADLARCLQTGADDFISKPVHALELRARTHSMLRLKQQHDRIQSFSKLQRNTINLLSGNLQSLRSNLALNLPHELKTPLNGILGGIALLIEDIDEMDSETIHQLLDVSHRSACRLENLIQRFSHYLELELATTALTDKADLIAKSSDNDSTSSLLIEHIAQTVAAQMERAADLVCQVEEIALAVSNDHLNWIMSELMGNALKFSPPKSSVSVRCEGRDGMAHLWITDRGRGLTHEQISSIDAFMQFERRTYEQQGAGLGLKIVQKVVELYGGRCLITSRYQHETTVHLTLPLDHSQLRVENRSQGALETPAIQSGAKI